MEDTETQETDRLLPLVQALRCIFKDLYTNPISPSNITNTKSAIKVFLELQTWASTIFSTDTNLGNLCQLLYGLKSLLNKLEKFQGYCPRPLIHRQITKYRISRVAQAVDSEIQVFVDRRYIRRLVTTLSEARNEGEKVKVLFELEERLSLGFDIKFQHLILRAKVFNILENVVCDSACSVRMREQAARAIFCLVKFNKNVFVGLVLMGPTIRCLIAMDSSCSIQVLSSFISFVRSPLVDDIECHGEIPRIVSVFGSQDSAIEVAALDCIYELAYIGRKEVIVTILGEGLIQKLLELQRKECRYGNDSNEPGVLDQGIVFEAKLGKFPFAGCVSRFAIQLEIGEGLSTKEKGEFKLEILRIVREVSISDVEMATITVEVLWGSSA